MNKFLEQKRDELFSTGHTSLGFRIQDAYNFGFRDAVALLWPCIEELKYAACDLPIKNIHEALIKIGERCDKTFSWCEYCDADEIKTIGGAEME